jgi:hypothetical protein
VDLAAREVNDRVGTCVDALTARQESQLAFEHDEGLIVLVVTVQRCGRPAPHADLHQREGTTGLLATDPDDPESAEPPEGIAS